MWNSTFLTNAAIDVLLFFYVIDCIFMGFVIMMQRSKQEGLGAAFGGGFTESIWGAQTSNVLVKATVWAAIFFFVASILLARLYSERATLLGQGSSVQQMLEKPVAPLDAPAAPAPTLTNAVLQPAIPTAPATPAPASPAANKSPSPAKP